jgi:uncharacterized protein (DUF4415 family)
MGKLGRGLERQPAARRSRCWLPSRSRRGPYAAIDEILGLYKPRKMAVTLRLDADVLAWFQRPGRGYQTRINRALREVMRKEQKESRE